MTDLCQSPLIARAWGNNPHLPSQLHQARRQRGVVLFVVLVLVLLATLGVIWGARTSLFNQLIVSNDADYQRAYAAAEAMLQDAELDIRGVRPNGKNCKRESNAGADVCRPNSMSPKIQFALEDQYVAAFIEDIQSGGLGSSKCIKGLCIKRSGAQDFWNDTAELQALTTLSSGNLAGARYGQFTGADSSPESASAILADTSAPDRGAWYWIEVLPYSHAGGANLIVGGSPDRHVLPLSNEPNVAYRITAIAYGRKPGTMVVLQENFVRYRHNLDQSAG